MLTLSFFGSFPLVGASVPWNDAADSTKSDGEAAAPACGRLSYEGHSRATP